METNWRSNNCCYDFNRWLSCRNYLNFTSYICKFISIYLSIYLSIYIYIYIYVYIQIYISYISSCQQRRNFQWSGAIYSNFARYLLFFFLFFTIYRHYSFIHHCYLLPADQYILVNLFSYNFTSIFSLPQYFYLSLDVDVMFLLSFFFLSLFLYRIHQ